ncbi:YncE family protein [Streptomyces sp. VNUA116]|uniref:YncE family protein n=1 Tax=Streptomyces sp. VNUA116 TaxID=3062449 RepID=UPI0026765FBC|nr:YncE family protein [Streptomyces sp. VNUA116]WKU43045.1 YncE family protein [Streptomyces sp. VNUA116]
MNDVLAVIGQNTHRLHFLDAAGHREIAAAELPPKPHEVLYDADRQVLYCVSTYRSGFYGHHGPRAHELVIVDARTHHVIGTVDVSPEYAPHGLALDSARGLLYISVEAGPAGEGGVLVVDADRRAVVERIGTRAPGPHWFAVTPDGTKGYATNKEAAFISVVDLKARRLAGTIPVGGSEGVAVTPDGRHVVAATPMLALRGAPAAPPCLSVFDTATDTLQRTIPLPGPAVPVHITSDGTLLVGEVRFVPAQGDAGAPRFLPGRVHIFAAGTFEPLGSVEAGPMPLTIGSSPDAAVAYVSNGGGSTVTTISLADGKATGEITIGSEGDGDSGNGSGSGPHGFAYVPARPTGH